MHDPRVRSLAGFAWGLALFFAVAWPTRALLASAGTPSAAVSQLALKGGMIVVALAAWRVVGGPFAAMGWRRPAWPAGRWRWLGLAALAMMVGTVAMLFLGVRHPIATQLSFPEIVVLVWVLSSASEEIFVRGLVQSWMAGGSEPGPGASAVAPPVLASAALFGAMHAPLIWTPAGTAGGLTLVAATLAVGWACAVLRARSGSLWPAIACHILANVAAVPGGVLGVLLYRLILGRMPDLGPPGP